MDYAEADRLINEQFQNCFSDDDEIEDIRINVKSDRTILNYKALHNKERKDECSLTHEEFMEKFWKDSEKIKDDKFARKEKAETWKSQATMAFRRKDYGKALCCYTKALKFVRDSPLLYNNRGLTQINLGLYDEAIEDFNAALRLNLDCLKSYLLMAKAYFLKGAAEECADAIKRAKERHPRQMEFIKSFVFELKEGQHR